MNVLIKNKRKISTLWNFFFLNLRTVIAIINGILIVPLYLHYININLYGGWLATGNIMMWLSIADPGVGDVLLQKIGNALGKDDQSEIGKAITSGVFISVILFFVVLAAGVLSSYFIGDIIRYNYRDVSILSNCFRIALVGTCFSLLANTSNNILLGFQKAKQFGFHTTIISLICISFNVLLLLLGKGIYAIAYTFLLRGVFSFLYSCIYSIILLKRENIIYNYDKTYTKSLLNIFVYTFFGKTFNAISGNIDLVIVSWYLGPASVTLLELSRRPIRILTGFVNNISISALPALSHLSGSFDENKLRSVVLRSIMYIIWITGLVVCGLVLFDKMIITIWVGGSHYFGRGNNIISCLSYYLLSVTYSISNILYSFGDIKKNNIIIIFRNLLYLIIVVFLIKTWGITGELFAFLLSVLVLNCTYFPYRLAQLCQFTWHEISILARELFLGLLFFSSCAIVSFYFDIKNSFFGLFGYGMVYLVSYVFYTYMVSSNFKMVAKNAGRTVFKSGRSYTNS